MSIRKIRLAILVTGGITLLVFGLILAWTSRQVSEAMGQSRAIDKVVRGVFELNIITNDYLLHHEERAQAQWQLRYSSLAQILTEVGPKYPEEEVLDRVIRNHAEIQPVFSQLITNYKSQGLSELEQRLASQLTVKAQTMVADTFRLAETARARVESAQGRGSFLLMASGVIILTLMVSTIVLVSNDIVARITNLHRGTEIIAAGDLDYQVDVGGRDEIGDLAHAFNEMTRQLRESYGALEEEITERKRAEEALKEYSERLEEMVEERTKALRESEQWLSTTLRSIGDAVIATDAKGLVTLMNPVAEELTGWDEAEAVGQPLEDVFNIINEQTGERAENPVARVLREGVVVGLANHTALIARDGTKRPIADSGAPMRDEEGNIIGTVMVFRDITERKEMEEQLVRQEKLAVLGQLSGGVGHELRNPLGVISNAIYYLQATLPDADETTTEYLEMISAEVRNSEKIVSDLLDLSRTRLPEREETAVSELVARLLEKQPPPEKVKVTAEIAPDLPPLFVDPRQIEQVLTNLVANAYDAMPEGGKLTIKARRKKDQVHISVTDTGCGISKENMKKLFEPLFTTKARGIGLGLAVSKNLVEANGGSIEVESQEGKGSTFTVILPTEEVQS